ncbi:MAG TPA: 5-(carboxyamino)imidazole ribonucleotide synthase [Acidimicrobiales bacterium]|nr:5-(carboxyamino)imidazole ribonucleotide synthase [Acidimicrobiales bacterium]
MSTHPIGFIGAGQLARMAGEAASALGLSMAVLAEHPDDAACDAAAEVVLGSPFVAADLQALAARCDVLTFDHEQVDLALVRDLVAQGAVVRPGVETLEFAVDKAHMRTVLDEAGVPVPAYVVVDEGPDALDAVEAFGAAHGWPVMLKAARGGYDGKGVWPVADRAQAVSVLGGVAGQVVVEELLPLDAELAVMVARRPSGAAAAWPAVETAQVGGVCREVLVPGRLHADVLEAASALGQKVAEITGGVGVMAVELFWSGGRLLVNEVATRPHNSGHWTMEGAVTSQFENHVRAVLDLPLGSTALQHAEVASVNIFGGEDGADPEELLARGLAVEGAHVHLYGKRARPGRKLGHVTVCGDDAEVVRTRAWSAAIALGTAVPDGIALPEGVRR